MKENKVNIYQIANIDSSFNSYQQLIDFYQHYKETSFQTINLTIAKFFAANMSAILGALLDKLQENLNLIKFVEINKSVERILQKNTFLTYFNFSTAIDNYQTAIPYFKLKPTDSKFFNNYIFKELLNSQKFSEMSRKLRNRVAEAIYEIFVNAQIHSESEYIYTCGQFYPNKEQIEFTIVDLGIGFKNKINERFKSNLTAVQAIKWAVKDRSTTKIGISGGIGLALLREFVDLNGGKIQIISNNGFYQYSKQGEETNFFDSDFPGTVVNLQFRMDDDNYYLLETEIDTNDIF